MAENLIRLKQLNQTEITGLVQNIISSNSYALTQNGGTGLNINNVGGINLNNLYINISGSKINFQNDDINLAYQFPPSTGVRRYYPLSFQSSNTSIPNSGWITYFPYLIRKKVANPTACIEMVSYQGSDCPIKIGIYSGNNGLEGAKLFWSGTIPIGLTSTGINRITINTILDEGPYILSSLNYSTATPCQFKIMNGSFNRQIFGENINYNSLGNGTSTSITFHYYETGIDLREVIGTGFIFSSVTFSAPLVCLEY